MRHHFSVLIKGLVTLTLSPLFLCGMCHDSFAGKASKSFFEDPKVFPIGVWLQNPIYSKEYAKAGVNLFVGLWDGPTDEQLYMLNDAGMKVICEQNRVGLNHINGPTIVGWMHGDEPDNAQPKAGGGYGPPIDPEIVVKQYFDWKAKDPSRPIYLNLGQGVAWHEWIGRGVDTGTTHKYPRYTDGADIVSFDIYPVNTKDARVKDKLIYVAKGITNLIKWSKGVKPVWCWIETTKISDDSPAKPTPQQVKSEVWMAIIHGARGIGYFCHSWSPQEDDAALLHDDDMIGAVANINKQITSLAPVLNSGTVDDLVAVTTDNPNIQVDVMAKRYSGATYIFAISMGSEATKATFSLRGKSGTKVEVLSEGRTLAQNGGSYTDSFGPYAVHIYRVKD